MVTRHAHDDLAEHDDHGMLDLSGSNNFCMSRKTRADVGRSLL